MFITQIDDHISLRRLAQQDAKPLYHLTQQNLDFLKPFMPWASADMTLDSERTFVKQRIADSMANKIYMTVILWDGEIIGSIDLHNINGDNLRAEIGYWLAQAYQGQGIMTKSVKRIEAIGFKELGLNRLEIRALTGNTPSRKVAERLHYHLDGILRGYVYRQDRFDDMAVYSLLKNEYERLRLAAN